MGTTEKAEFARFCSLAPKSSALGRGYTEIGMTEPVKKRRIPSDFWWGGGVSLIFIAILVYRAPDLYWQWLSRNRGDNERTASHVLYLLSRAQGDFRANDLDGNGVLDYWTGDVAEFWRNGDLIPRGVAEPDASPLNGLVHEPVP